MDIENKFFAIKRLKGNWYGVPALKNALLKEIGCREGGFSL